MLSILHVERSTFFQKIVKEIILHNGMNYYASTKVADAISVLDNMHIDLIITGLELEDGSGEELIEGLNRSRHRGVAGFRDNIHRQPGVAAEAVRPGSGGLSSEAGHQHGAAIQIPGVLCAGR
jgi:CheY-like chemotaxis protein